MAQQKSITWQVVEGRLYHTLGPRSGSIVQQTFLRDSSQVHGDRPTAFNASSGPRLLLAIHPGGEYAAQRDRLSNWAHHPEGSLGLRTAAQRFVMGYSMTGLVVWSLGRG